MIIQQHDQIWAAIFEKLHTMKSLGELIEKEQSKEDPSYQKIRHLARQMQEQSKVSLLDFFEFNNFYI